MSTDFASLPPEVQAQIIAQLQSDPLDRAVNDYGQGAGFLGLDSQPESWDRMGEKNDLYSDFFRTTQTYLPDWIPDLYPEVEDPGQFDGYRSDQADLYRNNPAFTQLEQFMQEGASFDEAVQLVAGDEQFVPVLPKTERGQTDVSAFRNSAEQYVSERAREGREFDEYDAERQAFEDYVNPRSAWTEDRGPRQVDDITPYLKSLGRDIPEAGYTPNRQLRAGEFAGRVPPMASGRVADAARHGGGGLMDLADLTSSGPTQGPRSSSRSSPRYGGGSPSSTPRGPGMRGVKPQNERIRNEAYNKALTEGYERMRSAKEAEARPSKKQENLAKLAAYYNTLMYGE